VRIAARNKVDISRLASLVDDPDAKVRLELATTLGTYDSSPARAALAKLALKSSDDRYTTAAIMSSLNQQNVSAVLTAVIQSVSRDNASITSELISQTIAMGDQETIGHVIESVCHALDDLPKKLQFESVVRILDGRANRKLLASRLSENARALIAQTIQQARTAAANHATATDIRAAAIELLGREPARRRDDFKQMERLLVPQSPVVLQQTVVAHLARRKEPFVADVLLAGWRSHSPALRGQILAVLPSRAPWAESLRQRLESGIIRPGELDASVRQRLLDGAKNRSQWQKVLATQASADHVEVLQEFRLALKLNGDSRRGAAVFRKTCINCHKIKNEGHEVGPQLASITNKTKEALLNSILDPNAVVDAKYFSYTIVTEDGRSFSGQLETETGSSITLLAAGGKRQTILRRDIEELEASRKSVMPQGIEKDLQPQDLADLIQFVRETFR